MSVLEVSNLSIGFDTKPLISNLSFIVNGPAFIAVIGHNGCGKSTFLRSLVNQQSYKGQILLNKKDLKEVLDVSAAEAITLLEQKNTINFSVKVIDLVLMGRFRFKKFFQNYSNDDISIVEKTLEKLSINHLAQKDFLELSGGEQQLVWLAQVIVQDTKIVLLDEPSQQLDVYNRRKIFDFMQYLAYDLNKIVLCITHDLGNLTELKGFYLNLSQKDPSLESISLASIEDETRFLEQRMV